MNTKKKASAWYSKKKSRSIVHNGHAISEIIGTILLLSISVTLLSAVYLIVLNDATSPSNTSTVSSVQLVASVDEKNVIFENRGGAPLSMNTKLVITVAGQEYFVLAKDCVIDTNGDGKWGIDERLIFSPPGVDSLIGLEVSIMVINPDSNSVLMKGLVQDGDRGDQPYVQTLDPYNVWPHSATLKSYYSFVKSSNLPAKFWYQWKRTDDPQWKYTSVVSVTSAVSGYQEITLYNLTANKNYLFEAWIQYNTSNATVNKSGGIKLFTTQIDSMGLWHFDEPSGITFFDSSGQYPPNDGALKPSEIGGPWRVDSELNHSSKCLSFDGIDDSGQVANAPTLCITDECTIEGWVNRSQHCNGSIGTPAQSSLTQFGDYSYGCYDPCMIHVSGDVYAIVSVNENSVGFLATVDIKNTGSIITTPTSCIMDQFAFDPSCRTPKIIAINETDGIYGIVYTKASGGNGLYVKTIQIFNTGNINTSSVRTSVLDISQSATPDIIHITGMMYAVVYAVNADYTGKLITLNITDAGVISPVSHQYSFIKTSGEHEKMQEPEIIKVESSVDIYVIVYNCIGDDGGIRTVQIKDNGSISDVSQHVWFDDNDGGNPEILHIHDDVYAIVYAGPILRQSGFVKTIKISATGNIDLSRTVPPLVKSYGQMAFESTVGNSIRSPHIIALNGSMHYYSICYNIDSSTANLWGKIATVNINDDGTIVASSLRTTTFEPSLCSNPYLIPLTNDVYGIVYRSDSTDGIVKTIQILNNGKIPANPILDVHELGGMNCYEQDELLTSDGKYVIDAFRSIDDCLLVRTAAVNQTTKTVSTRFTDAFTLERGYLSSNGTYNASFVPTILPIANDVYAVVYCHYMSSPLYHNGKIKTIKVNGTGHISLIETYTFDTNCMNTGFSFISINESTRMYAIGFRVYSNSQGKVVTIKIGSNGHIFGLQDSYVFETGYCQEPSMICVHGDVYAVAYRDSRTPSNYGRLATLKIYGNGTIKKSVIDLWQFCSSCYHPSMVKVQSNIFAVAYVQYASSRFIAWLSTIGIADNGTINKTMIDSLEFTRRYYTNNYLAQQPEIVYVKDRTYAIVFKDLPDPWNSFVYNGDLVTLRIGENGNIVDAVDGTIQVSSNPRIFSYDLRIIPFVNDSYIVVYGGMNNDIYQCVVRIPLVETTQNIFSKKDSYTISANKSKVFVSFTDSNNQVYTLSANLSKNWNYIVCTYDKTMMNLYLNASLVSSLALNGRPIKVTSQKLLFGPYNGCYDEFTIYAALLSQVKMLQNYDYYSSS